MQTRRSTFTKRRIPSTYESSAAEPALQYEGTRLYVATRGQSATVEGSSFGYSDDSGVTWSFARLPGNIHYTPLPFEIIDGTLYLFGSERGENEWNQGTADNRNSKNRPRSFMLRAPLAEAVAGNFANMTTTLLGYEIYEGEQVSSGVGVGSTLYDPDEGKLIYFLSSEDFRNSTRYSLNLPSVDDESLAWGYQPDIYAYEILISKPRAGLQRFELRGPDMHSLPVFRYGNNRKVDVSVRYKEDVVFETKATATELESSKANVAVSERVCPTNPTAAATLVLPQGYGLYKIAPAAGAINVTAITRTGTTEGDVITIVWNPGSSGGAVTFVDGGFLRLAGNRTLGTEAVVLKLQRIGSYWQEIGYFSN